VICSIRIPLIHQCPTSSSADAGPRVRVARRRSTGVGQADSSMAGVARHALAKPLIWHGHPSVLHPDARDRRLFRNSVKSSAFSI